MQKETDRGEASFCSLELLELLESSATGRHDPADGEKRARV